MRLLVFSDIHNNIAAVQSLRQQEKNEFDAVVIAGDIGNKTAPEFFSLLDTFQCPVYCVYGNWDHELPYVRQLSAHCILLQASIEPQAGYFFAGFSGCPTHWGQNPIYKEEIAVTKLRHQRIIASLMDIQAEAALRSISIEEEFKQKTKFLKNQSKAGTSADQREKNNLCKWRDEQLQLIGKSEQKLLGSPTYRSYVLDRRECHKNVLSQNRQELLTVIQKSNAPSDKIIVLTHERLFRLADYGLRPLLHIFGHRHEYKITKFADSYYLNASTLDESTYISSEGISRSSSGYCSVVIHQGEVIVERRHLISQGDTGLGLALKQ